MGFIVHSMCFVVLLSACYADDSMESTVIRCNHQCSIETVECSANCRMEDVLDKSDVLSCLADCKLKSETCDTTCIAWRIVRAEWKVVVNSASRTASRPVMTEGSAMLNAVMKRNNAATNVISEELSMWMRKDLVEISFFCTLLFSK